MYVDKYVSTCPKFLYFCLHCSTKLVLVLDETTRTIRCCNGLCMYRPPMLSNRSSSKVLSGDHLHPTIAKVVLGGNRPNLLLDRGLPTRVLLQHQLDQTNLLSQDFLNGRPSLQGQELRFSSEVLKKTFRIHDISH